VRAFWPTGGLWRQRDFLKLWSAETVSQVGSQVSGLAIPFVAIVKLKATPFEVALLSVFEFAPFILISLPTVLLSPVRSLRQMPEPVEDPLAEAQGDGGRLLPGQMPAVEDVT
jgi:hypothetical protein